uniref:Olfactory receptor n=1 Tax=Leptobrachium leishanense TaxID=445787 RepID=A0A8C5LVA7_9ANUR
MDLMEKNQTEIKEFLLLGFQNLQIVNHVLFVIFLLLYILTVSSNLLIIILVVMVPSLRSPMYFFLSQLSLSDILVSTNITPNMLRLLINGGRSRISVIECITQLGFHGASSGSDFLLLAVMSYDRYVAICDPLHYVSIMNLKICLQLVICSWFVAFISASVFVVLVSKLRFCGPDMFDHYFCDFGPLLELSCSEPVTVRAVFFVDCALAIPFVVFPFIFIISTYICIFITIFGISSTTGRQKAFSTCSSHLIVVTMYYGTVIAVYLAPSKGQSFNINKILSLQYTIGSPCLNPIIYSLRNQEIKKAFMKCIMSFSKVN